MGISLREALDQVHRAVCSVIAKPKKQLRCPSRGDQLSSHSCGHVLKHDDGGENNQLSLQVPPGNVFETDLSVTICGKRMLPN